MNGFYLGIDVGTSSVKLILSSVNGERIFAKSDYCSNDIDGWCDAIKICLKTLSEETSLKNIRSISLSSQVGTYITDKGDIIPWHSSAGSEELKEIKSDFDDAFFIDEIGMAHPDIISYPLPRLLYIKRNFKNVSSVMMPKDAIILRLTDNYVTDIFSQRGICHPNKRSYSQTLLNKYGIDYNLPKILHPTDIAGTISEGASEEFGLLQGTPVYVGCNDFYSGLLGMGVFEQNTVFELSGTSEHIGLITKDLSYGKNVSSKYFNGFVTYGGTKSSGTACDFAIKNFDLLNIDENVIADKQPIFLPYLNGERAPIYDENAKGVFFGISGDTSKSDMAYSVVEGVVFSLYNIAESLNINNVERIIIGGGSAENKLIAKLKAQLFNAKIFKTTENNASALGAAIIAMVGDGVFGSLGEATKAVSQYELLSLPSNENTDILLSRYKIFKKLYCDLKERYKEFSNL